MRVIFDTDFSSDVGDLGALACALALHKAGQMSIAAIGCCTSNPKSPGAIDAVRIAFGVEDIQIGTWKGDAFDPQGPQSWAGSIFDNYPHNVGLASTVDDAVDVYVDTLTSAGNSSVTIIAIGPLNQIDALLTRAPDLVEEKVAHLVVMGGVMPSGTEFNFEQSPAAASRVVANWPSPITYVGFEVGNTFVVGDTLNTLSASDVVRHGYNVHGYYPAGRTAWDECAVLAAIFGSTGFSHVYGRCTVNSGNGSNTWSAATSTKDRYVVKSLADSAYKDLINALMVSTRSGAMTSWGSGTAILRIS